MRRPFQRAITLTACLLISVSLLAAVDVSGTWTGTMQQKSDHDQGGKAAIVFHLKQQGSQVSGTAGPAGEAPKPIREAKLEGDRLTFTVGGGSGPTWKFELRVSDDSMQGTGEGTSASGQSMGTTQVSMSRQK
jgi:hypothetical protein